MYANHFKFFLEGFDTTPKQKKSCTKLNCCFQYFMLHFNNSYFSLTDGKKMQFGSSSMPPSLLKALPSAMNLHQKVEKTFSILILWSSLARQVLWSFTGLLPWGFCSQARRFPCKGLGQLLAQQSAGGRGAGSCWSRCRSGFIPRTCREVSLVDLLGMGWGLHLDGLVMACNCLEPGISSC